MKVFAIALLALLAIAVALVALPIVALIRAGDALRRLKSLERRVDALSATIAGALQQAPRPDGDERSPAAGPAVRAPASPAGDQPAVEPVDAAQPQAADRPPHAPVPPSTAPRAERGSRPSPAVVGPSLEERIGGHWLLYAGVVAIFLATAYFIKYAFDNAWVTPGLRVAIGIAAGVALGAAGRHFAARGFALYGQMLAGAGAAILFLSVYAAQHAYGLITPAWAFAALLVVTATTAWLAASQAAPGLALMAVVGGYLAPFLVSTGQDAQLFLFTYIGFLAAATMYLARRQQWPALNLASFVLTGATVAAWAAQFYAPAKWLRTELFITLYAAMFVYVLARTWRGATPAARWTAGVLATGPVLYHAASLLILQPHPVGMLIYLLLFTSVGIVAAQWWPSVVVRAVVWVGAAAPFLGWVVQHPGRQWLAPGLATLLGLYGLHLSATLREVSERKGPLRPLDVGLLHLNGAWACIALLALLLPHAAAWQGLAALVLGLANGAVAAALARRAHEGALHFLALAFTLLAVAVTVQLDGAWVTAAWAAEGFALAWIGAIANRSWLRAAGAVVFAGAVTQLLQQVAQPAPAHYAPLLNPRGGLILFFIALLYAAALIHRRHAHHLPDGARREVDGLVIGANLLTWLLITVEINRAFGVLAWEASVGQGSAASSDVDLARETALSVSWSAFALVLIVVGFVRRFAPLRYLGIAIFGYTVAKVALVDLAQLERLPRILSLFALGALLLVASYLYQQFAARVAPPGTHPDGTRTPLGDSAPPGSADTDGSDATHAP